MNDASQPKPGGFPCGRMLIAGLIVLVIGVALTAYALNRFQEVMRSSMESVSTGDQARGMIDGVMGARLPNSVRDTEYRAAGFLDDLVYATAKFSLPPADYATFIAQAKPFSFANGCLILPLKPEGTQAKKPNCPSTQNMTISIDKSIPALWRITIDVR